jgi:predicted transposase YdaD
MSTARIQEIVRQFPENGMKLLLHNPQNARDLLALAGTDLLGQMDFARLAVDPTSYVASDFRHVESDLVLTVPLRTGRGRKGKTLTLYILIEHQSEPDRLMALRVLDYMTQIWKAQARAWGQRHGSLASVRLQPILPVVFYTGTHRWAKIGRLVDLIEMGSLVEDVTPAYKPLFVNLPDLPAEELGTTGGCFGWVLRLVQQRRSGRGRFEGLLGQVVGRLEAIPPEDRLRWLELLSYVHALVYHERAEGERRPTLELVEASVRTDEHRQEVREMRRTIADALRDEGRQEGVVAGKRETLLSHLRQRFKELPQETERRIETTSDVQQLNLWLSRLLTAKTLEELAIQADT